MAGRKPFSTLRDQLKPEVRTAATQKAQRMLSELHYQQRPGWIEKLRAWAASHPETTHYVDASHESIYEDRDSTQTEQN